jgi:hypothetical protein
MTNINGSIMGSLIYPLSQMGERVRVRVNSISFPLPLISLGLTCLEL